MKKLIALFLGLWAFTIHAQDSLFVKDGQLVKSTTTEVSVGTIQSAATNLAQEWAAKTASFSADYRIVRGYDTELTRLARQNNDLKKSGLSPSDTLLSKAPEIITENWSLGNVGLNFRHNGTTLQYRTDTSTNGWQKAWFLGNSIVLRAAPNIVLYKLGERRYEAFNGTTLQPAGRVGTRSVQAPPDPEPQDVQTRYLFENGTVEFDGVFLRYDNRKKKWVVAPEPPPATLKIVKIH